MKKKEEITVGCAYKLKTIPNETHPAILHAIADHPLYFAS